jgi:hypothetical protein
LCFGDILLHCDIVPSVFGEVCAASENQIARRRFEP